MTTEQFDELINVISQLNGESFSWNKLIIDVLVSIVPAFISALVAYHVAKLQIKKSEEQQKIQRDEEIKNRKKLKFDELKAEYIQKILISKTSFHVNIINMIMLAGKEYNRNGKGNKSKINISKDILLLYNEIKKYLSDLTTLSKLLKFNSDQNMIVQEIKVLVEEIYGICFELEEVTYSFDEATDKTNELMTKLAEIESDIVIEWNKLLE